MMIFNNQWWKYLMLYLIALSILLFDWIESRYLINNDINRNVSINQQDPNMSLPIHLTYVSEVFHSTENIDHRNKQDKLVFSCQTDGYFSDPKDRQKFHICILGIDIVGFCPDGAIWDNLKRICFYNKIGLCQNDIQQIYQTNNSQKVNHSIVNTTGSELHISKTSTISSSSIINSSNLPLNHQTDSNRKSDLDEFSSMNTNMKNKIEDLNTSSINSPIDNLESLFKCPIGFEGYYPDPYDCSCYHFCYDFDQTFSCCEHILFFDRNLKGCGWPEKVQCQPKCPPDGRYIRISSTKGHEYYYDCIDGKLNEQKCPEHQIYSASSMKCQN